MTSIQEWSRPDVRRLNINGIAVAVETVRNGETERMTLVWLHGLGSASTLAFAGVARHPRLAGVTSYLIDLPGYGLSDRPGDWTYRIEDQAEVVRKVLAEISDAPIALFGHSMGGSIAIACAVRAPEAAARLIVAEPNLDPGKGTTSAHIASQSEQRFVNRGYRALLRATEQQAGRGDVAATDWLEPLRVASPIALHRSAVSLLAERSPTFREQLAGLAIPWATISGELSPPLEPPLLLNEQLGYVVSGAGHSMHTENPDGFVAALVDALAPSH